MSKATIVSFYPLEFDKFVPHIFPSKYDIPPSDGINPQTLVIDDGFYFVQRISEDRPPIEVPIPSDKLANSLVSDFRQEAMYNDSEAYPAVFYINTEVKPDSIISAYSEKVKVALQAQTLWFQKLVRVADDIWAIPQFRQHKLISDIQRFAAKQLNLDRDWMTIPTNMITCPACFSKVNPAQAICKCGCIINEKVYATLKFAKSVVEK